MVFDCMMVSGLAGPPINKFVSRYTNVTWNPNEYDISGSSGDKVQKSLNPLSEGMGEETFENGL